MAGRTDLEALVYQMSTDIRQLERQNRRALDNVGGTASKIEARYKAIGKSDPGQFLNQTFDRSRLAVFEAGAARIPIFGQALEALGPAGLIAAGGLAATALAATQAIAAMQFADEIDDTAQKLNIGTDALQEYRFALTEVGGEAKDADSAIESFQKKLGEGLAGGRAVKWFERLGFSGEDLRAFASTEDALAAVMDRIAALGSEAERAAVADKLGLGSMISLAREGSGALEDLREKARDLGYVMDADLVKKGAEANQQFETMSHIVNVQLKSSLVELSDEILTVAGSLATALSAMNDFLASWAEFTQMRGQSGIFDIGNAGAAWGYNSGLWDRLPWTRGLAGRLREGETWAGANADDPALMRQQMAMGARRQFRPDGDGARLASPSTGGGRARPSGPSPEQIARQAADLERSLALEIARLSNNRALVQVLEREDAIVRRTEQYLGLQLSATEARTRAVADQERVDEARIQGQMHEVQQASVLKDIEYERMLGNERYAQSMEDRYQTARQIEFLMDKGYDVVSATAMAEADLLDTQRARAEVTARIVADAALEHQITMARLSGDEERLRVLERADEINRRARQIEGDRNLNYGEGVAIATDQVDAEISAATRRGFRDGIRGLLDDLQDGGLEGVLTSIFDRVTDRLKDNLADLLTDYLMQLGSARPDGSGGGGIMAVVSSFMGGFGRRAHGGPVRPGRSYIVGEHRPEVFVPSEPGSILPSLSAVSKMPMISRTVVQHITYDNRGAMLFEQAMAEQRAFAMQQARQAATAAFQASRTVIPSEAARRDRFRLG